MPGFTSPPSGSLDFRSRPVRRLEFVWDASGSRSSATDPNWSLRNADAPVGMGQIAAGSASQLHLLFQNLGYEVTFSYSPARAG